MSGRGRWWREEEALDPWTNMERDAALLAKLCAGTESTTVRVYQWDRPSVTIGRLQEEGAVRQTYPRLPIIRRPTGGRAVLHGDDLTITIATLETSLPRAASGLGVLATSQLIVSGVSLALAGCGVRATYGAVSRRNRGVNCFETSAVCDLVESATGRKILGSAQRREQGAILQQMSLRRNVLGDLSRFEQRLREELATVLCVEEWVCN